MTNQGIIYSDSLAPAGPATMPHSPLLALRRAVAANATGYLASGAERISFPELEERSSRFANFLASLGVQAGHRVAAVLVNSVDVLIAWFGTNKAGAVWVPVNTGYAGEWLRHQLADSDPVVTIVEDSQLAAFEALRSQLPATTLLVRGGAPGAIGFDQYKNFPATCAHRDILPGETSLLIYTSGTTGRSKGCIVSHNYICNYARLGLENVPRGAEEVLWTPLPLAHLAGLGYVVSTLMLGGRSHFAPRFSVSTFWDEIERSGAHIVPTLGIAATLLAAAPDCAAAARCHGQLRVLTGAVSPEVRATLAARFGVKQTYVGAFGQSEGGFVTTLRDKPFREGSSGLATDSFEIMIVDAADRPLPPNEVGELVYRPRQPYVMSDGYWNNPAATAGKSRNLWWHSGDFGKLDESGYFYFTDRGDDRLRRSGENVSSVEVEEIFACHPAVAVVAAHAVSSELGEDEIKVTVVLRGDAEIAEADLWLWAKPQMPKFALPRFIELRPELPRNPTGKILKHALRAEGVTQRTWDSRFGNV